MCDNLLWDPGKEKLSQLDLTAFKDPETATRNCCNDFKHQHGGSYLEQEESVKCVQRNERDHLDHL